MNPQTMEPAAWKIMIIGLVSGVVTYIEQMDAAQVASFVMVACGLFLKVVQAVMDGVDKYQTRREKARADRREEEIHALTVAKLRRELDAAIAAQHPHTTPTTPTTCPPPPAAPPATPQPPPAP